MEDKILNNISPSTLDSNIEIIKSEKKIISSILNETSQTNSSFLDLEKIEENTLNVEENDSNNALSIEEKETNNNENIDTTTDCLALTVRENYHIVVVKNFFKKSARISWKIALSIITINFLNMFL